MTTQEFRIEFDTLYNNIMSNVAPGLNSYEKSIFLTQAQEQLIQSLYEGEPLGTAGFEVNENMMQALKELIVDYSANANSKEIILPDNVMYIIRETALEQVTPLSCTDTLEKEVTPVTHDKLSRILKNPFRGTLGDKVLRVLKGNKVVLYSNKELSKYNMTYIRRPLPIILEDLPEEYFDNLDSSTEVKRLSIDNRSVRTECELNPNLHRKILVLAVQLAKIAWKS